jgi:hypothetical protein
LTNRRNIGRTVLQRPRGKKKYDKRLYRQNEEEKVGRSQTT